MHTRTTLSLASLLGACLATPALGQTVIGTDDFDGGGNFLTRAFSPDNIANNGQFSDMGGTGSFFDRFGIIDPNHPTIGVPFDFLDDSTTFPTDTFGIFESTDRDRFVGFADLANNQNPSGVVTIDWTFDISGSNNLSLAVDFAAVGNFATDESVTITASIDGGAAQPLFVGAGSDTAYTLDLESGTVVDRYDNVFFDGGTWDILTAGGPFGTVTYSASDVDQDGVNDTTLERTYVSGPFTNDERILFDGQFLVNGVGLDNGIQTLTAPISGTGTTLTLTLTAEQNGGFQIIAIDDLVLTSLAASALVGDFNSDGFVSQGDLDLVLLNWGDAVAPAGFDEAALSSGGPFDSLVSQNELDDVLLNWGNGTPPAVTAVPEPTSLVLLGLGGLALATRRRLA